MCIYTFWFEFLAHQSMPRIRRFKEGPVPFTLDKFKSEFREDIRIPVSCPEEGLFVTSLVRPTCVYNNCIGWKLEFVVDGVTIYIWHLEKYSKLAYVEAVNSERPMKRWCWVSSKYVTEFNYWIPKCRRLLG